MHPESSSNSKSLGIAVISLDFSSVASWPNTERQVAFGALNPGIVTPEEMFLTARCREELLQWFLAIIL